MSRLARSLFFLFLLLVSEKCLAQTQTPDSVFASLYQKASEAIDAWDMKNADFYLARYLGLAARNPGAKKSREDLGPLVQKRKLDPKAFLPGDFDKDFLQWFEKGCDARWGAEEKRAREKYRSVEIENGVSDSHYFATVVMTPELQSWYVVGQNRAPTPMTLAMGSASEKPLVFCGKVFKSAPPSQYYPLSIQTQKHAVHYLWKPEFYDLDRDGVPELWLRYNLAWGNGFAQVLGIYKIDDQNKLVLFKEFRGEHEGIARRLGNDKVEVAMGFGSRSSLPPMDYDRHRLEVWKFTKGEFHKVFEKNIPHILKGPAWKKFYDL